MGDDHSKGALLRGSVGVCRAGVTAFITPSRVVGDNRRVSERARTRARAHEEGAMLGRITVVIVAVVSCGVVVFAAVSRGDGDTDPTPSSIVAIDSASEVAVDPLAEQWSSAPALSPQFVNVNEPVAAPLPE